MRPFSAHIVLLGHELAVAFGQSDPAEPADEPEAVAELMPVLSETERDVFGFSRFDRPDAY